MKDRKHHNNDGRRQIKRGKTRRFVKQLARRLGIRYVQRSTSSKHKGVQDVR